MEIGEFFFGKIAHGKNFAPKILPALSLPIGFVSNFRKLFKFSYFLYRASMPPQGVGHLSLVTSSI